MAHGPLLSLIGCLTMIAACGGAQDTGRASGSAGCERGPCDEDVDANEAEDGGRGVTPSIDGGENIVDGSGPPAQGPLGGEPGYGFTPGEPFPLPELGEGFVFVPVAGTVCQDGSASGIAIERGSDELLIYLEGGGACFNDWTCLSSSTLFASRSFSASDLGRIPTQGIFSKAEGNPVRDWTKIFIGYCTGDVFSGAAVNGSGYNNESQAGFVNMRRMLARIVPSLPQTKRVLLTGSSAGGFGALVSWVQAQEAFGTVPVDVLADSGPMFSDAYLAPCLQHTWRDLWRLQETLPPGCSECQTSTGGVFGALFTYLVTRFPERRFGLMSYTEDTVIRLFYGAGEQKCGTLIPSPTNYPGPRYTEGLLDLRTRLGKEKSFSTFYVAGSDHTFLVNDSQAMADGHTVFAWLDAFLHGSLGHAGP